MTEDGFPWNCFPGEIQNKIIGLLPIVGGRCSQLATVSQVWRSIIEPLNFAEISLTVPRLVNPDSQAILFRKRNNIRYIWFRVELKHYDCEICTGNNRGFWGLDNIDNRLIMNAFESLFTTLSAWEPRDDLVLDISVYSPSDNQHWFKHLSFCSDTDTGEWPSRYEHEPTITLIDDMAHGWIEGQQIIAPRFPAHEVLLEEIMAEGLFDIHIPEMQWWRSLPLVPAVGVVLLRQQTRRRWKPTALANMLTQFPNMKELCYEPWRESGGDELRTDQHNQTLIESFHSTKLCNITIFENFNEMYLEKYIRYPAIRVPDPAVSRQFAHASRHLTMLSASFMADASPFFAACQNSWTWDKLTSLTLTSRVLSDDDASPSDINNMLRDAAATALQMPKLDIMELWDGRRGVAMLFRYQKTQGGQPAIITLRGTSLLTLDTSVLQAWEMVAHQQRHDKIDVQSSWIDPDGIECHGDAICQLELSTQVVRPISLQQILREDRFWA